MAMSSGHPTRITYPDIGRIKTRQYGDQLFIADRISGHWIYVSAQQSEIFKRRLAARTSTSVEFAEVDTLLKSERIGYPTAPKHFGALRMVIIKITNACNYACRYCYDFETTERARVIDEETIKGVISQALTLCRGELTLLFHGGEPTLVWPLIEKLVLFSETQAKQKGKSVVFTLQTNLSKISERVIQFSNEHEISWGISIDGEKEINDQLRITHKEGESTYAAFEHALESWPTFVKDCGIMSTITKLNVNRLVSVATHFRDLGFRVWDWSLFQPTGRGRDSGELTLDVEILLSNWLDLFNHVLSGTFDGFVVKPVKSYIDNFFNGPGGNMCMRSECGAARDLLSVSADGTLEACDCIDPRSPVANLGNARTTSVLEARSSEKAKKIRARDMSNAPMCRTCIWYAMCGGTCLAYAPSLSDKSQLYCSLSLVAFDAIAAECAQSGERIERYLKSLHSEVVTDCV